MSAEPPRTLVGDLQRLLARAGVLTAVALLIGGAGPGVLLKLLGLEDAATLLASVVTTAPLSLTVGAGLILVYVYRDLVSAQGLLALLAVAATVSVLAARALGQVTATDVPQPPPVDQSDFGSLLGAAFGVVLRIVDTLALFLRVYGLPRFALAIAGGVFLSFAYVDVLLPRIGGRPVVNGPPSGDAAHSDGPPGQTR